jgi:prepilin-type N-terminal cleavage/methylation domain-containing protein
MNLSLSMKSIFIKSKQSGVTLIELVTAIVLVSIVSMVLYPILFEATDATNFVVESTEFNQETNSFLTYTQNLLNKDAELTVAGSDDIQFSANGNTYRLYAAPSSGTTAPYKINLVRNGSSPRTLTSGIAQLTSPTRAGFEMVFYNQGQSTTNILSDIRRIEFTLSFHGQIVSPSYTTSIAIIRSSENILSF